MGDLSDKPVEGPPSLDGSFEPAFQPQRYGDYELIYKLAEGGMAEVFLARKRGVQGFQKLVVVKRVLPRYSKDQRFVTMFLDEARLAAQLDHPNIVQVHDLGQAGGTYFIAMEYLRGQTIRRLMKRMGEQTVGVAPEFWARIMEAVLNGLHFAHDARSPAGNQLGIVHRDVTPQNIMVTYDGAVKLIDFGVARAEERSTKTNAGAIKGKFSYLAPEQCEGKAVDRRADVFQAGIVLWELVTGKGLFRARNELLTMKKIIEGDVAPPSSINPAVQPELERIILKGLCVSIEQRYQTAAEMREELRAYLRQAHVRVESEEIAAIVERVFTREREADQRLVREVNLASVPGSVLEALAESSGESGSGVGSDSQLSGPSAPPAADPATTAQARPGAGDVRPGRSAPGVSASGPVAAGSLAGASVAAPRGRGLVLAVSAVAGMVIAAAVGVGIVILGDTGQGSLSVKSKPTGASVTVNGVAVGKAPVVIPDVPIGSTRTVRVTLDGYATWTEKVKVATDGETVTLTADLVATAGKGSLEIVTTPPGARVEVDGVDAGKPTPAVLEDLPAGTHGVTVALAGYVTEERKVTVSASDRARLLVELRPVGGTGAPGTGLPGTSVAGTGAAGTGAAGTGGAGAVARAFGTLNLDTNPYTTVYLGAKKLGDTPLVGLRVPAGKVVLRLVNDAEGIKETYTVTVPKDGEVTKKLKL